MRKLLILILALLLFICSTSDTFFSLDKADHFMTALVMTLSSSLAVRKITNSNDSELKTVSMAITLPIFFSFAKEAYDGISEEGTVSYKDLIYDFAGIIFGIIIMR
ncbi:MAG: hypothetical protein COX48_05825 [bacterium (Candidatus Stahlbacteria) CG23_combo_of_CG06-09_8_20_14_all_34_7]|nr:MAG: hypothetical protein COX48_05825 [bacterium (Candidatus Stahlbacteria) CG23_combo_of_CG06-09_8_20_14_all_34_7]